MNRGRALRTAVTIAFLYANVAVISGPVTQRLFRLPLEESVADAFNVFGVFWYWEDWNRELVVEGERRGRWIRLDVGDLLPYSRGERLTRAWADRRIGDLPGPTQQEASRRLARAMRRRWNRLHPDRRVERVRIVQESWPRSERGYEAKKPGRVTRTVWHTE